MTINQDEEIDYAVKHQSQLTGLTHFKYGNKILEIRFRPDLGPGAYFVFEHDCQDLIIDNMD